ncbi:MAG: nucleotide kinase domain-containing protein [Fimbriiglobus sp.]
MNIANVKKMTPPDRLVYFVTEREAIRRKKDFGLPRPWTDDEILDKYRFCNVRRMDDKVSEWLLANWYRPHRGHPHMLEAVALARFVNKPESLECVTKFVFRQGSSPDWPAVKEELRRRKQAGHTVFNAAYMVRGNTKKSPDKIGTVVDEYIGALISSELEIDYTSMETTHSRIEKVYGFGSFMAGQVVADLRHAASGSWRDKYDWAPRGPGSTRGLNRFFGRPAGEPMTNSQFREEFGTYVRTVKPKLPPDVVKRLEAHDLQNVLCETDKMCRVLLGEGRPKQLY